MTTQRKGTRPKAGGTPDYTKEDVTAAGQRVIGKPNRKTKYSDDQIAAARALWEGDPRISKAEVAKQIGVPFCMVDRWSKGGKDGSGERWEKRREDMSEAAQAAADRYVKNLSEYGEEITPEQQRQAMLDTAEDVAVDLRAKVIDRHRKEVGVVRTLLQEALSGRQSNHKDAFEKAKLAKITAESLTLTQTLERKAWGIDTGGDTKVQVVIERED